METVSRFNEKPKNQTTWKAMWLGLGTILLPLVLSFLSAVIRPIIDPESMVGRENSWGIGMGFGGVGVTLILVVYAIKMSVESFKQGERSWILWLGFISAVISGLFWFFMIIGELLFPH